jgi:hypothetical protein
MVLTDRVRTTRRRLLGGGLGVATLAGCGVFRDEPKPPPAPDPLQPVLDEALALAGAYDRVIAAQPALSARLTPLAADHRAHAAELAKLIVTKASAPPPEAADSVAGLRAAELAAQKTAVAACGAAPADRAGLVGSIAACRATHAEALR